MLRFCKFCGKRYALEGMAIIAMLVTYSPAPALLLGIQPGSKALQHEVSVTIKLIQAYVTDKAGSPIHDLTSDDFLLFDNNKPVVITAFEKHVISSSRTDDVSGPPATSPLAQDPDHGLSRKFVIILDFAFNTAGGIKISKEAVNRFLDTGVERDDEVALLTYSMLKGVKVHEFLTRDHGKIRAALAGINSKDTSGRADEIENAYAMQIENPSLGGASSGRGLTETEMARLDSMQQAGYYFRGLTRLAQAFRLIQGEKSILFFSNGIPSSLVNASRSAGGTISGRGGSGISRDGQGNTNISRGSAFEVGSNELRPLQETMMKEFMASNCAIYALDTRESSKIPALFDLDEMNLRAGGGTLGANGNVFRKDKTTGMDTLKSLAKRTGGKYFPNIILHEKSLNEISAMTGAFYVLGYTIPERSDGKFHKVRVEVKRKGCAVRAQSGYFGPKPFNEYSALEKQLHLFDLALNEKAFSRIPIHVPMTALSFVDGGIPSFCLLAKIPREALAELIEHKVEFITVLFDSGGAIRRVIRTESGPGSFSGRSLVFRAGPFNEGPGEFSCRLVIRDMDTGMSALAATKALAAGPRSAGLQLGTPLVLEPGAAESSMSAIEIKGSRTSAWPDVYAYDHELLSPVFSEVSPATTVIHVIIPYTAPGGERPELALSASLADLASGGQSAISTLRIERIQKGPLGILSVDLPVVGIPPGTYCLHFNAEDRSSGSLGHSFTTLTVPRRQ